MPLDKENDILTRPAATAAVEWTWLLVGCRPEQYAASLLAHAVEDCDAHLLNLNVVPTAMQDGDGGASQFPIHVELCVNLRNVDALCRSLERYGYTVLNYRSSDGGDDSRAVDNYNNLMRYLDI